VPAHKESDGARDRGPDWQTRVGYVNGLHAVAGGWVRVADCSAIRDGLFAVLLQRMEL
jgi:hypothetical protein